MYNQCYYQSVIKWMNWISYWPHHHHAAWAGKRLGPACPGKPSWSSFSWILACLKLKVCVIYFSLTKKNKLIILLCQFMTNLLNQRVSWQCNHFPNFSLCCTYVVAFNSCSGLLCLGNDRHTPKVYTLSIYIFCVVLCYMYISMVC